MIGFSFFHVYSGCACGTNSSEKHTVVMNQRNKSLEQSKFVAKKQFQLFLFRTVSLIHKEQGIFRIK